MTATVHDIEMTQYLVSQHKLIIERVDILSYVNSFYLLKIYNSYLNQLSISITFYITHKHNI